MIEKFIPISYPNRPKRRVRSVSTPHLDEGTHDLEVLARLHQHRLRGMKVPLDNEHILDHYLCVVKPANDQDPEFGEPINIRDWEKGEVDICLSGSQVVTLTPDKYWVLVIRWLTDRDKATLSKFGNINMAKDMNFEEVFKD